MSEKAIKWTDLGYKAVVILGGVMLAYLNANFVSKKDFAEINKTMASIHEEMVIANVKFENRTRILDALINTDKDHEMRIRALEIRGH